MNEKGFTLIELMIVVAIIGILAAIAIPNFLGMQEKSKREAMKSMASEAKSELHSWMDSFIKVEFGVIDVDNNGILTSADKPSGILANVPSSWIASFYTQNGTKFSPWFATKGIFTNNSTPQSGQITFSLLNDQNTIFIRGYDKNAVEIFSDSLVLE